MASGRLSRLAQKHGGKSTGKPFAFIDVTLISVVVANR